MTVNQKVYRKGQSIKFKTHSGRVIEGTVYDSNEYAIVVVNNIFGQFIIDHKDVIEGISDSIVSSEKDEWEYYAAYNGQISGNPGHYSPTKNYPGAYGYLSPDVDDDGC